MSTVISQKTVVSRKYEVIGQLGHGSMGIVYQVSHVRLDTLSALKVLRAHLDHPEMVTRFYREARLMARLKHPNIVRVLDIDHDDALNLHYFVMEYVPGKTLLQYLQERGPLPLPEVLGIARQAARALEYAHSHTPSVIHRDIKPANLMIEDNSGRVVVMDFGIAKELDSTEMTRPGVVMGTMKYCAPEQMRHEPIDGRVDIYSLGMVMYEAYTGAQFFTGIEETAVIGKVLNDAQENEPRFSRPTPPAFIALVAKAIAKAREKRYPHVTEFLSDLESCWTVLDGIGTRISSALPNGEPQSQSPQGELEKIEEQLRKLEAERQRYLLLPLQRQAQEAREKAAREGAGQWVSALFQQGLTREEKGHEYLRLQQYSLAQEAYQEAITLFGQAGEQAVAAVRVQRAEHARHETTAVKAEAERYGAKQKARTLYGRGLALQVRADEFWEQQAYQEAGQVYGEAQGVFEDARELAYRLTLKEEAEAAQEQAIATRARAVNEGAEEFAPQAFQDAVHSEQRAVTATTAEEFTQARELYAAARQQYELAQQQARIARQRQHTLAIKRKLEETRRQAAVSAGLEHATYRQAADAEKQGEARFAAQDYEQAAQAYEQAREGYERAAREAEHERNRQTAERARQHVGEARASAEQAGARERFAEAFAQGQQRTEQGRECEKQEKWSEATECYEQAVQQFGQLRQEAEQQVARELAEVARSQAYSGREEASARARWAQEQWQEAQTLEAAAETAWQAEDYPRARERYIQVCRSYEQIRREAEHEQLRQALGGARQQAVAARKEAEQEKAERYAAELLGKGRVAQQRAERSEQAQEWRAAIQDYGQARELFAQAVREARREQARQAAITAEQERLQQQALEACGQAIAAQKAAEEAEAGRYARELYQKAREATQHGEQGLAAKRWEAAAQGFSHAQELFLQVIQQRAEQARQDMAVAKAEAEQYSARKRTQGLYGRGLARQAQADELWERRSYQEAWQMYTQAHSAFTQARDFAHRAILMEEAEAAKARALTAKEAASKQKAFVAGSWQAAANEEQRAHVAMDKDEFGEARKLYDVACQGYELAIQEAEQQTTVISLSQPQEGKAQAARSGAEVAQPSSGGKETTELLRQEQFLPSGAALEDEEGSQLLQAPLPPEPEVTLGAAMDKGRWIIGELESLPSVSHSRTPQRPVRIRPRPVLASLSVIGMLVILFWMGRWLLPSPLPPLILVQAEPLTEVVEVTEGKSLRFLAETTGAVPLHYQWTLEDQHVSQEREWTYRTNPGEGSIIPKTVWVRITDQKGRQIEKRWQVIVSRAPRPPQLRAFMPPQKNFELTVGGTQEFGVEAIDLNDEAPAYAWTVNGEAVGAQPTLTWKARGEGRHQVQVVVRNRAGLTAIQEWQVVVLAPLPEKPLLPKSVPPQIVQRSPDKDAVTVQEGERVGFSAAAMDPDGEEPHYVWSVDGKKVAQGDHFAFLASGKGVHWVDLIVTDQSGLQDKVQWKVLVDAPPPAPQLVMFTPHKDRLSLFPHQSRWFGVEVEVPGTVEPTLHYNWKVDGRPVAGRELYEYKNPSVGVHVIDVTVTASSGASVSQHWIIEVREEKDEDDRGPTWSPRLEIVDTSDVVVTTDQKQLTVTGKVRNIDKRSADNVVVWVTGLDENNQPLIRRMGLPIPQPLAPDQVAVFRVSMANLASIARFRVEVINK